jgi:hypothetical protein
MEEERTDRRGPHVDDRREKTSQVECANLMRRRLMANTPRHFGPAGLSWGGEPVWGSWAG